MADLLQGIILTSIYCLGPERILGYWLSKTAINSIRRSFNSSHPWLSVKPSLIAFEIMIAENRRQNPNITMAKGSDNFFK